MTTDNFCFYLQNRLIQTSQTGGQWYSDTSPFSIPWTGGCMERQISGGTDRRRGVVLLKVAAPRYLIHFVVDIIVGEGFEVFEVVGVEVDGVGHVGGVGHVVSRKKGGRRRCGVRQRRRISLSYPVLIPTEQRPCSVGKS